MARHIDGSMQGGADEALYAGGTEALGFAFGYGSELINGNANAPQFSNGAWFFTGAANFSGFVTIGNVITGNGVPIGDIYAHELDHVTWQSAFGRNYLPASLGSVIMGQITDFTIGGQEIGAFGEHFPFQACSYTDLYSNGCPP